MLSTTLSEAADRLGRALSQTPVLAAFRAASDALDKDEAAQRLLADLGERQDHLRRLQQAGLAPSQTQIDAFRLCQAAIRANETVMAHLRATNATRAYLPAVAARISATLGTDFGRLAAPPGAC